MQKKTPPPLTAYFKKHPYQGAAFIRDYMKRRYMCDGRMPIKNFDHQIFTDSDYEFKVVVQNLSPAAKSCMRHARKVLKQHKVKRS